MRFRSREMRLGSITVLAIAIGLNILSGCSKSNSGSQPITTTPVDTYQDPAVYGTPFASVPATKDIVMYELNLRSFSNTYNIAGALPRLDSIKALGVNVIWIMPTYPVGVLKGIGSPYSVKDYNGVNTDFGTLADLRNFVAQAHTRGMAVILDWVGNDTSWDNAWISNKSWYQQDASGNIISPIGTTWTDVAALNYNNTDMRTAMIRAMKYWVLTANVDGYRCDHADGPPVDFWTQAIDTLKKLNTRKLIFLSEGTVPQQFNSGFQMNYAFDFYTALKGLFGGTQTVSNLQNVNTNETVALGTGTFKLRYITNHDNTSSDGSAYTIYNGKQGSVAAFALAAYMNGVPLIYNGQEVGCPTKINFFVNTPIDWTINPDMTAAYKKIIAFRAANEAAKTGVTTFYPDANIVAFEKISGTNDVVILVNARNSATTFTVPAALQNIAFTNGLAGGTVSLGSQYTFQPYTYLVLKKS
jgi:glycosidase